MKKYYMSSIAMSGLFRYLSKEDYSKAWQELNMAPHNYNDQQIIYCQGETVGRAGIIHSGLVKGERLHSEGASSLTYYYAKGELFAFEGALSGKRTSPLQLTADDDTCVIFFDVQKIFGSSFERQLTKGLMELLANDDIKKLYHIEILSKKGLRDRILTYFNIMASRNDGHSFTLNMSREQLAKYLCVNRSALSYELHEMKRDGVLFFEKNKYFIL